MNGCILAAAPSQLIHHPRLPFRQSLEASNFELTSGQLRHPAYARHIPQWMRIVRIQTLNFGSRGVDSNDNSTLFNVDEQT